jgi:hypothetical protein
MKIVLAFSAVLFLYIQTVFAEAPIGRLFSTPSERATLNNARQTKKIITQPSEKLALEPTPLVEPEFVELPDAVSVQGYVKRSDGKKSTVWVNNEMMQENTQNQAVKVGRLKQNSNRVPVKILANKKDLSLKAGQVYNPETNRVNESRYFGQRNLGVKSDSGKIDDNQF